MVISILANGDIKNIIPENIYQGSNKANTIYVVAPFSANIQALISFEVLTTGQVLPAIQMDSPTSISNELNMWKVDVSQALTQYYGEVKYQIKFVNAEGEIIATAKGKFRVQEGVDFELPPVPDTDTYTSLLQKLSDIEAHFLNGWIEAQGLRIYNPQFTYSLNSFVLGEEFGVVNMYKSLTENNLGNELSNTEYWQRVDFGVDVSQIFNQVKEYTDTEIVKLVNGEVAVDRANKDGYGRVFEDYYLIAEPQIHFNQVLTAKINHVESGETVVGRAKADKDGNIINDTYFKKQNVVSGWSNEPSHDKVPSEKLVKDTLSNFAGGGTGGGINDIVFDTYAQFLSWLDGTYTRTDGLTTDDLTIGMGVLLKEENTSDYWCSSVEKPITINNFTPFEVSINLSDYLAKNNNTEFVPTGDYNPATKKYVDDKVEHLDQELGYQNTTILNIVKGDYLSGSANVELHKSVSGVVIMVNRETVVIDQPSTATQGILEAEDVARLQANMDAYIIFANEAYYLNGKEHNSGYLTYTNVEYENNKTRIKTITITLSTLSWVMTENVVASESYVEDKIGSIDQLLINLNSGSGV